MKKTGEPYANWQDDGDFDAIVIGSGIGGLAAAALLAKHDGQKVLVLERHTKAGGFTHAYSRKDWDWDVGVHYIGQVHHEGSMLRRLFDEVGDGSLEWEPMGEVYDTVVIGGQRWEYVTGREAWRDRMHLYFPDETEAIDRYLERVREAIGGARTFFAEKALPRAAALVAGPWMRRRFLRHSERTLGEVLDEVTGNPTLKAVLAAQFGDHGLPPSEASFVIHAMIFNHYLGGAAYPVGGASRIAASVAPVIEASGGEIIVCAEVASLRVEGARAVGVCMADGREIRAPLVISDVGIPNTVHHLMPEGTPGREALKSTLQSASRSASHICLYVGFDATDEELGLGRSNLWVYHSTDQDGDLARYLADPEAPLPLAYISFPSAKDPDFGNRHPGKATVEVVSIAPYERFQQWEDTKWMKRGEDYEAVKDELSRRLIEVLEREVPQIAGKIAYSELSTPLSTRHFSGYDKGEIYGLEHTPARFRERALRPKTGLKGFYLTGQDVCTAGVAGALFGAVLCASTILGRNLLGEISREKSS
jgi:all-trans-retinol 13,14-reductase